QDRPQGHLFGRLIAAAAATAIPSPAATPTGTAAAAAVAAAAAAAILSRLGLINRQSAALDLFAVKRLDGRLGLRVLAARDEAESFRPTGVAVHDDLRRLHSAVRLEELCQSAVRHAVGQIAYVELFAHGGPPEKKQWRTLYSFGENVTPGN